MSKSAQQVNIALNAMVIVGLVICLILAGVVMKRGHDTALLLANTKELAQELRQSSDDLTRFIRTYTVTGNRTYWDHFLRVIAIRDGQSPLPKNPWRNYWDLYISDGKAPNGYEAASALIPRMRAAKFTDEEMELLEEAKRQSDALIDLEDVASHAMEGRYRPTDTKVNPTGLTPNVSALTASERLAFSVNAPADAAYARSLVHGNFYHIWKGNIMRPLDQFAAKSNQRVLDSINSNFELNLILICILAVMLSSLIGLLLFYFFKVAREAQTGELLATMLPLRVVEAVSVKSFTELREAAAQRAVVVRKSRKAQNYSEKLDFPVLYSEFLPMAWVAFTDVVGFTQMCRTTSSKGVISVLNELFSMLDVEAAAFGVEKIKTIGDAFMAAKLTTSELHSAIDEKTRTRNISYDGLVMVKFLLRAIGIAVGVRKPVNQTEGEDAPVEFFQLRVGLHAGPVASGIVGFERPLYDLFGDTVNTAARLESSGRANRIQIMDTTAALFDEHLSELIFAQNDGQTTAVDLKGIGRVTTKFITGVSGISRQNSMSSRHSDNTPTNASSGARKHGFSPMEGQLSPVSLGLEHSDVKSM